MLECRDVESSGHLILILAIGYRYQLKAADLDFQCLLVLCQVSVLLSVVS